VDKLSASLINILEVWISLSNKKASPDLYDLHLSFIHSRSLNLDSCLDAIFGLNQITSLSLSWYRMSLDMIKCSLRKQGDKKRWERLCLRQIDREMGDLDILEICYYLPSLLCWMFDERSTLTIDGAREWKRICPNLDGVQFMMSEEVKEVLNGLKSKVSIKNLDFFLRVRLHLF
jgi:hypothetical protein